MSTSAVPTSEQPSASAPGVGAPAPFQPQSSSVQAEQLNMPTAEVAALPNQIAGIPHEHLMTIIRSMGPHLASNLKLSEQAKPDAAAILANINSTQLQQQLAAHLAAAAPAAGPIPAGQQHTFSVNEPGPSTHPRGPPNLGQVPQPDSTTGPSDAPILTSGPAAAPETAGSPSASPSASTGSRRGRGGGPPQGSDEWTRQRKDNHKEVERRRRGNINEGINELGRIVPSGSGEKAKGAILSRAVQYIHHLKENEARNIEKWTLEKLLMDQAMGDLQSQLDEMRQMYEGVLAQKEQFSKELELLRSGKDQTVEVGSKRRSEGDGDAPDKRQRTE